jgi:hypothetical protein
MIRERIDIHGVVRDMETRGEVPALQMKREELGLIKEAPTLRWLEGQELWDKRFKRAAKRVLRNREKVKSKAQRMLDNARDQGLLLSREHAPVVSNLRAEAMQRRGSSRDTIDGIIQEDRRWGPLDLDDEDPPPSAIAKRRDTVGPAFVDSLKKI